MPEPQYLIFDIDGTLVNTEGRGALAFSRTGETAFGIKDGTQDFSFAGATDSDLVNQFLVNHDLEPSEENRNQFFEIYHLWLDYYIQNSDANPYHGVRSLLPSLTSINDQLRLGLLTGNTRLGAEIKLRHYGIWNYFEVGAFGCEHPDRNVLAQFLADRLPVSVNGANVTIIGDTLKDLRAAQSIGARFIGFCSGKISHDEFMDSGADKAITSYKNFPVTWFHPGATQK